MSTISLRKASPNDLSALIELEFAAFSSDRISRRSWKDLLVSPAAIITVANQKSAILGSTVLLFNARTSVARLYSIAVAAEARRRHVAQLLIDDAIAKSAQRGASLLRLETRIDNIAAQKLFDSHGFAVIGRTPAYYEDGAEAIRYERALHGDAVLPSVAI